MSSKLVRLVTLTSGVAAAGVLFATSAFAHGAPYAVTAGSAPSGTAVAVTGTATGQVVFQDSVTTQKVTCSVSVLTGSITTGSSSGNPLATINGGTATFSNASGAPCTGPAGISFKVTGSGTWNIVANDTTSGVTKGTITNIRAHLQSTAGPTCGFDVGLNSSTTGYSSSGTTTVTPGTQGGTFTNSTQNIVTDPAQSALALWNVNPTASVHNCVANSVLKQGDAATFTGTYNLKANTAAYNPIAVN